MKRSWLPLFAMLLTAPSAAFDRSVWQDDFAYLKKQLESRYANLAWFASPQSGVDARTLDRRATRALAAAADDADAKAAITDFINGFGDGHLSLMAALAPKDETPAPPKRDLHGADATTACAALGYASTRSVPFSLPFESLPDFSMVSDGESKPFRAGIVTTPSSKIGVIRIKYFRQRDYPGVCESVWSKAAQEGKTGDIDAVRDRIDDAWYAALADQLKQLRAANLDALIVDVGGNGGGNDAGEWTPRMFTDKPAHSARLLVTATPSMPGYLDEEIDGLRDASKGESGPGSELVAKSLADFEHRKQSLGDRACDLSYAWHEQRPWQPFGCSRLLDAGFASGAVDYLAPGTIADAKRAAAVYWPVKVDAYRGAWTGPAYVLTDGRSYSAAEMFTAVMRDNAIARTVGVKTGGAGCGFMHEDPPVDLPHSHLRVRVPSCVRLRADGSDEVAGIKPDLEIAPREGEDDRTRASRVIAAVAADLRTHAK